MPKDNTKKQWYASLMLNRLMFCYFIQKRGFLNNDMDYIRNKLKECMRGFVEDEDRENAARRGSFKNEYKRFREILADIQNPERPNQRYYIYKTIILRGLYGVDLMKEAVEIAKLRLFLKLVAAVDADYRKPNLGLEPLPDIDFNIRAGNTLVGFASRAEFYRIIAVQGGFDVVIGNPPYVEYSRKKLTTNLTNLTNNFTLLQKKQEIVLLLLCHQTYFFITG